MTPSADAPGAVPPDPDALGTPAERVDDTAPRSGGSFRGKAWFWVPVVPLIALDLWTKYAVFAFMEAEYGVANQYARHPVWGGFISFDLVQWYNTGTVWGLFRDFNSALVALRFGAIALLIWFAWTTPRRARLQLTVLGVLLAGAVGNLYDNLTVRVEGAPQFDRGVRDFLLFSFGREDPYMFPAFNVADSCITVGAICLVVLLWREDRK